jgi:hypothetical protein
MVLTRKMRREKYVYFDQPGLPFPKKEIIESNVSNMCKNSAREL